MSVLLQGGDLKQALAADKTRGLQWYRRGKHIMLGVVKGVVSLHANNVVHGNIKSKVRPDAKAWAPPCMQLASSTSSSRWSVSVSSQRPSYFQHDACLASFPQ